MISIDFSQVDENNLVPEGPVFGIVDSVQVKDASDGQSQYLEWYWEISEGEHMGRRVRMITSLKSTVLWRLKQILLTLNVDTSGQVSFEIDDDGFLLSPDLVGRPAVIVVKHETYQSVKRASVDDVKPIATNSPMSSATATEPSDKPKTRRRLS